MEHHDHLTEERVAGTLHRAEFSTLAALLDQPRTVVSTVSRSGDGRQHGSVHRSFGGVGIFRGTGTARRADSLDQVADRWAKH
jgi:hypothetical protein